MEMMCWYLNEKCLFVELNLENCGIMFLGCVMLLDVVLLNKILINLDLSVNFIVDVGVMKLFVVFECNKSIKIFGLNMCGIINDGFLKMFDVLECNLMMIFLKFCYNWLGKEYLNFIVIFDDLKYRVWIVMLLNLKFKIFFWGNLFDD